MNKNSKYVVRNNIQTTSSEDARKLREDALFDEVDPGTLCQHQKQCNHDEACCTACQCNYGDSNIGDFNCQYDEKGHKKSRGQPGCCGGDTGMKGWCAKAGTPAGIFFGKAGTHAPKTGAQYCSKDGMPTPANDFYRMGDIDRCVKVNMGCNAGNCDNPPRTPPPPTPPPTPHPAPPPTGNCGKLTCYECKNGECKEDIYGDWEDENECNSRCKITPPAPPPTPPAPPAPPTPPTPPATTNTTNTSSVTSPSTPGC